MNIDAILDTYEQSLAAATLRQRCEATWDACYTDRRKWADIGEDAQEEWLRVFGYFDAVNK